MVYVRTQDKDKDKDKDKGKDKDKDKDSLRQVCRRVSESFKKSIFLFLKEIALPGEVSGRAVIWYVSFKTSC